MTDFIDLARRLKERDPQAMAELYNRFGKLVYSNILSVVRNEAAAEDLTQETFLRIWNSIHSFDCDRGSLGAWIMAVARNRALDYLRSVDGRMERTACDVTRLADRAGERGSGEQDVLDVERLRRAVAGLAENQRLVLELAYSEGMSQTEIATQLRRPVGTVKTWARTALKVLRERLEVQAASA